MKKNEIELGEMLIRTFDPPPEGFNPLTASDKLLQVHGYPPKPDPTSEPALYKAWSHVYAKPLQHIVPTFLRKENKVHGPNKQVTAGATSNNWSGSVVVSTNTDPFAWVAGTWTVPDPCIPGKVCDGVWRYSSAWVGIDGYGSSDVLQAGTEHEVVCNGGTTQRIIYAWWEWYPEYEIQITNFPVSAGDVISCIICANLTTKNTATIYMSNLNAQTSTNFNITAPAGTTLVGNSAEWIVETPTVGGTLSALPDYGVVYFDESRASRSVVVNADTGTLISLVDSSNAVISTPTAETTQLIKCVFSGTGKLNPY